MSAKSWDEVRRLAVIPGFECFQDGLRRFGDGLELLRAESIDEQVANRFRMAGCRSFDFFLTLLGD